MSKRKMKVLFIGLGGIGQRHLCNVYAKFGDAVAISAYRIKGLRYVISPDLTTYLDDDIIKKYSIKVFMNLKNALADNPDSVFVCNPTSQHLDVCLAAAKAGCDLFIEKPLSHSMKNIKELMSICKSKKLITHVGFQLRFHPCYLLLKKLIAKRIVGNLLSVHIEVGELLSDWHKYENYRQGYAARKEQGGGVVLSQIHEIDYLYDLFGLPKKLVALGGHLSKLDIDVEDVVDVLLEMTFENRKLLVSLHMDYIQRPPSRYCKIIGENGQVTMDIVKQTLIIEKKGQDKKVYDFSSIERNKIFIKEIDHFFGCVINRKKTMVPIEEGVHSLKVALAIKKSMETGEIINKINKF